VAKIRFRFTRTDGLVEPPFINFAYTGSISPTYRAFAESYGFSFSANDLSYMDRTNISGYIAGLGDGYIDFYVEFNEYLRDMFFSRNSLTISITCQAIANVAGNLSVERII
jgi:antirestriction protein